MELPILENDAPVGKLRIRPQGLYTVFEARLPPAEGLSRLWLLGAGRRCCLGLLEPRAEGRFLSRRLTRLQLASLPPRIDTALVTANAEWGMRNAELAPIGPAGHFPPGGKQSASPFGGGVAEGDGRGVGLAGCAGEGENASLHSAFRTPNSESSWLRLPDGSLVDPARRLLALPCAPGAVPAQARKIVLDGREYWLFRT